MTLPTAGQTNWSAPLNAEITNDEASIAANTSAISAHTSNSPADPHGDRAYAQQLVAPVTTGTNAASGYLVLDATGHIPATLNTLALPLTTTANANNTASETIIGQFSIPANDWTVGLSSYDFRMAGTLVWASAPTLTLRWRLGTLGTLSDPVFAGTLVPTLTGTQATTQIWDVPGRMMIDASGNWWPMGFSFSGGSTLSASNNGTASAILSSGVIVYVTLSAQWGTAASGNNIITKVGHLTRIMV